MVSRLVIGGGTSAAPTPPRLVRRFAIYAAVALIVAAVAAFFFVRRYADRPRRADGRASTPPTSPTAILPDQLRASDFGGPVGGRRLAALDHLAHRELLTAGAIRVKLYNGAGLVVYSSDHQLIGDVPLDDDEISTRSAARRSAT